MSNLVEILRRVAGAVGQHHAVGVCRQNDLSSGGGRQDGDGAAPLLQLPDNIPLSAVVQEGNLEFLLPLRRVNGRLFAGDILHHTGDGISGDRRQISRHLVADGGIHDAVLPDDAGQLPGVHAVQARHALLFQIGVQVAVRAEIGGSITPLPDHISLDAAFALKVLPDDAVVADEGIGLHDDLARVAGVGQGLDVAAHAGGKHQLTHGGGVGAEADALKNLAVLEH